MKRSIYLFFTTTVLLIGLQEAYGQQHDKHWIGVDVDTNGTYSPIFMGFESDEIIYQAAPPTSDFIVLQEAVAMSDASGNLQFYTNGNVVVSWDGYIMEGGKGFNEGTLDGNTMNAEYVPYTYQLIPDGYEEGVYYMLHSFITVEPWGDSCYSIAAPKMQISKIDMRLNESRGKVAYKNHYFDEEIMAPAFAVVRHGNGHDWWLVRHSPDGLYFRSTLLRKDSVLFTVESTMQGLSSDWFDCWDLIITAQNLLEVSPDGSMLLNNYGVGHAKLMDFDRCSGEVSLIDTFSLGTVPLVYENQLVHPTVTTFAFSPSGRYLYGVGWGGFAQYDLWASDILASKVLLGGVPWDMDDLQNVLEGQPLGYGAFCLGPDGKLYSLYETTHNVIEYPDELGESSGYCVAADNPPSCLGPDVPYYLFSTPHPHYRLGPLTGSGCDTILSSTKEPVAGSDYGVSASPTVASGQVEVSITLPGYGSQVAAEIQVVDMLGRVMECHRFPPYAYLHWLDVSGWAAGLYNVVLLENGRVRAAARLVVAR
ncbi:MAG: hypothetical protein K9J37_13315 [Saprospiraceae bacterium]|nr:hypothetical protein [Saprospiraceae bacterium]MCF8250888.1 hypothetical protein [Saprospiraceae bacterium]MCF8281144.1 hypothetical protein [Bacteroidales bacterium]MCF8312711.1 hypothetical protein [Saprospiraceae bacterium]MCF8441158.1 hypothetical protein [Saprospiraceae bacterium]